MTAIAIAGRELTSNRSRLATWAAGIGTALRQLGPYVAIEILLPGGTLLALLLWLYRRSGHTKENGGALADSADPCSIIVPYGSR